MYNLFNEYDAVQDSAKYEKIALDNEMHAQDKDFIPIKAHLFFSGNNCLFDVFVKINSGKFIKILQVGDEFEQERLDKYFAKNVEFFYIRKEAQENFLRYTEKVMQVALTVDKIPLEKKFTLLFNQCEMTMATLSDLGVNKQTLGIGQRYTANVVSMTQKLSKRNDYLGKMLKEELVASLTICTVATCTVWVFTWYFQFFLMMEE